MSEALRKIIIDEITASGPMGVPRYMELCLSHPEYGYYMGRDPFGRAGDFITAPEISQMFGEMIGAWLVHQWQMQGAPERFILLECGPGRGTLMADILRAASKVPAFMEAAQINLLEISPVLRTRQKEALRGYKVNWCEVFEDVANDAPLFVVGNEFLDALPITQYQFSRGKWQERCVVVHDDALAWGGRDLPEVPVLPQSSIPSEGDVAEVSVVQNDVFDMFVTRVVAQGGAVLVIDYGYFKAAYGDTLQAIKSNSYTDVLAEPGEADLTAHVNFEMLAQIAKARGLDYFLSTQGEFLKRCGIEQRAQALLKIADDKQAGEIQAGLHRLTASGEMGELFKVIEFSKARGS